MNRKLNLSWGKKVILTFILLISCEEYSHLDQAVWVLEVLDGDTFKGRAVTSPHSRTYRITGIDAPEQAQQSYEGGPVGEWSTNQLRNWIGGKWVWVSPMGKGYYGRELVFIYSPDKQDLGLRMISLGLAVLYRFARFKSYRQKWSYINQAHHAQMRKLGLYSTTGLLRPSHYRKQKKAVSAN